MKGTTHLVFGLLLSAVLTEFVGYQKPLLAVILILLGSLLPDIDEKTSRLGRKIPLVSHLTKHRTFFHGILFLTACVIVLALFLEFSYVLAFVAGFVGHLLLDAMTPMGVVPLWPSKLKLKGFVKVGGWLEKAFFAALCVVFVWLLL